MSPRRGRSVVVLNGVVAATIIAVIAAVALVVNPPAPPGIAEFAPQAAKAITKAPAAQVAVAGLASCGATSKCSTQPSMKPSPKPSPPISPRATQSDVGVPSNLQCFDWPDGAVTQTFDPQSPPCVAGWAGQAKGNGGATSKGVTGSTIRVVAPAKSSQSTLSRFQPVVDFINTHYQLFGRKIEIVPYDSEQADAFGSSDFEDPGDQHADAAQAVSLHPFASLDYLDGMDFTSVLPEYVDYLAQHGVVSLFGGHVTPNIERSEMQKFAPYEWSYSATTTDVMDATAGLVCNQLKGRLASHSGDYKQQTRKFAIVVPDEDLLGTTLPGLASMQAGLAACGLGGLKVFYDPKSNREASNEANMTTAKKEGYTTLIWFQWAPVSGDDDPQSAADSVNYHPEWVEISRNAWYSALWALESNHQIGHTFGVSGWQKVLDGAAQPWMQAFIAGGGNPDSGQQIDGAAPLYRELQMLASGVQNAGPHLTPQSFAAGLHSIAFPNPGARVAPSYQGAADFAAGSTTMMSDFTAFWDDESGTKADYFADNIDNNPVEFYCYENLGDRFTARTWPDQDRFYQGRCR